MIVLGLDASSDAAAVGLVENGVLLCEYTLNNGKNHSVKLLPMVETMLQDAGLSFSDIDVYSCGVGPGSFTGVRIGVATAKGFAQSWRKPVVPVCSLEILAENLRAFDGLRVACVYARADELYCAAYDKAGEAVLPPSVMTLEALLKYLSGKTCRLCGDGAEKYREEFLSRLGGGVSIAEGAAHVIRGGAVAELGYHMAQKGEFRPYDEIAPMYLRVSQAEREYEEKQKENKQEEMK